MSVILRTPGCTGTIGGNPTHIASIRLDIAVGQVPSATVTVHATTSQAVQVVDALSLDIATAVGNTQAGLFKVRTTPDGSFTINDGQGNTLVFQGYLSSPYYGIRTNDIGFQFTFMHQSAELAACQPSIYAPSFINYDTGTIDTDPTTADGGTQLTDANIPSRALTILKLMRTFWRKNPMEGPADQNVSALSLETAQAIDKNVNTAIETRTDKVLSQSTAVWQSIIGIDDSNQARINELIASLVVTPNGNMLSMLLALCEEFQLLLIPIIPGSAAAGANAAQANLAYMSLIRADEVMSSSDSISTIAVPVKEINWSGGNTVLLPVTCVMVVAEYVNAWSTGQGDGLSSAGAASVAVFPNNPLGGGRVITIPGPSWLSDICLDQGVLSADIAALNLADYGTKKTKIAGLLGTVTDAKIRPVLNDWAETAYLYEALLGATGSVEIPMDLSQTVGQRVQVTDMNGKAIFKAFLTSISHNLTIGADSSVSAKTMLGFSHIEAGSFVLPGSES